MFQNFQPYAGIDPQQNEQDCQNHFRHLLPSNKMLREGITIRGISFRLQAANARCSYQQLDLNMSEKKHHKRGELSHRDSTERMKKQAEISRSQHRAAIIKRLRVATPQELEQQPEPVVEVNEQILARAVEQLKNADASIRRTGLRCLRQCLCSTFTGILLHGIANIVQ